jgi:hypothetical protein
MRVAMQIERPAIIAAGPQQYGPYYTGPFEIGQLVSTPEAGFAGLSFRLMGNGKAFDESNRATITWWGT